MSEEERIFRGVLFCPGAPELKAMKLRSHKLSALYSATSEDDVEAREALARLILAEYGEGSFMQGPVFFHYGRHTRIGRRNFFNYNLTVQDDALVTIGDDNNFGPNTTIVTPLHPLLPAERRLLLDQDGAPRRLCYAKPVTIGSDCWFGAGVTVCPGVAIGDGAVVGAGSVVTRDLPRNCVAAGVPCRVLRTLSAQDSLASRPEILGGCRVMPPGD